MLPISNKVNPKRYNKEHYKAIMMKSGIVVGVEEENITERDERKVSDGKEQEK